MFYGNRKPSVTQQCQGCQESWRQPSRFNGNSARTWRSWACRPGPWLEPSYPSSLFSSGHRIEPPEGLRRLRRFGRDKGTCLEGLEKAREKEGSQVKHVTDQGLWKRQALQEGRHVAILSVASYSSLLSPAASTWILNLNQVVQTAWSPEHPLCRNRRASHILVGKKAQNGIFKQTRFGFHPSILRTQSQPMCSAFRQKMSES
nr:uncharacterized protein LOC119621583 [Chlorocebus sabaeus]